MPDAQPGNPGPASYTSCYIDINGNRLHYLDYGGTGRTLLCLHGGGAHAHWFDFVAGAFTNDHHVLSLDQRGHGDSAWADPPDYSRDSMVADVKALAETLDLRDFVLMGHSMGGMISLVYAATHPGRVRTLIVLDSTLRATADYVAAQRERAKRPARAYASLEEFVDNYRLRPARTMATPQMLRYMAGHAGRQFEDGMWRHKIDRALIGSRDPTDGVALCANVKIPFLLVKAGLSERVSPSIIQAVKANCPQVELAEVPDSEHHVSLDNPAATNKVVREFLDRQG